MKIKKNGKTINLTESDIKILSKRILKEAINTTVTFEELGEFKGKKITGTIGDKSISFQLEDGRPFTLVATGSKTNY